MPFERLQRLGEEKFGKILNHLMRGETCQTVARMIQQPPPKGWSDYQDVTEGSLMAQLSRLRHAAATRAFDARTAKRIIEGAKPNVDRLARVSVRALDRMEELSEAQREVVMVLLSKALVEERTYTSVNEAVEGYRKVLLDIQKLRFDLGLDEFKGPVGVLRGASQTTTFPDGMSVQKQIFEAVTTIERVFEARKIPHLIAPD